MSEKDESTIRRDNLSNWRDEATLAFIICGRFSESRELGNSFLHRFGEQAEHFFFPHQLNEIEASCQKRGLYLFSGPVGSGKQQPCIVWLKRSGEQQVIAIEDPVEIEEKRFYSCKQMKKFS